MNMSDPSNGYQAIAEQFIAGRGAKPDGVGAATVCRWARRLRPGTTVLDLGCGSGMPIAQALVDDGFLVYGIDASPTMIAAFRSRFSTALVECSRAEDSSFFGRTFDAVIAWGLMFLLAPDAQRTLIHNVARALNPGAQFLFTAPRIPCEWLDNKTRQKSVSLGAEEYTRLLNAEGLVLSGQDSDDGSNDYYFAHVPSTE